MASRPTCFVISPIGSPNSPIRSDADETFEYIIKTALDKYDFVVERADHIRGISDTITQEMVERIKRSDLCIVDLTGLNPNVMYECGRRHETGKPCILISRDEKLPFDILTHPVITYSVSGSVKDVINTIRIIQQNVQSFVDLGFELTGYRTVDDVYYKVEALGQRVDQFLKQITPQSPAANLGSIGTNSASSEASMLIKKLGGVAPAISYALANRDTDLLDQLLPRFPNKKTENFVVGGLVQGAAIGSRVAFEMLEQVIISGLDDFSWDVRAKAIGGYAAGASRLDEEARALPIIEPVVQHMHIQIEAGESVEVEPQTMILNALQRTLHGLERYDDAIRVGNKVLELSPLDGSFLYNQALNFDKYSQLPDLEKAERDDRQLAAMGYVDRLVAVLKAKDFSEADDDHLALCIRMLIKFDRIPEARELFFVLENQHPLRAQIIRSDDDYKRLFL
jgi:tetratricopeptide (TPR) repeat protein